MTTHPRRDDAASSTAGYLAIAATAFFFSTGGAAIKATSLSSWEVASFRSGLGAVALLVLLPQARRWANRRILAVAAAQAATLLLYTHANKLTTAANTIFLQSTAPLYILLVAPRLLGERPRRTDFLYMAVLAAGTGAFFVGIQEPFPTAPRPELGNVLAALSGLTWALTILGLRWLRQKEEDGASAAATTVAWGNLLAFLVGLPAAVPATWGGVGDWLIIGYLGVFQIAAAYALMAFALGRLRALEASLFLLLEPVLNTLWAWWIHAEEPGSLALAGGALIVGSTAVRAVARSDRAGARA